MCTSAVIVLIFYVAFTQPNCPAMNTPLFTFNMKHLLPLCRNLGVGSVTVLSAVLKSNRNIYCRGTLALYVTSKCFPIYAVRFYRKLTAIRSGSPYMGIPKYGNEQERPKTQHLPFPIIVSKTFSKT